MSANRNAPAAAATPVCTLFGEVTVIMPDGKAVALSFPRERSINLTDALALFHRLVDPILRGERHNG